MTDRPHRDHVRMRVTRPDCPECRPVAQPREEPATEAACPKCGHDVDHTTLCPSGCPMCAQPRRELAEAVVAYFVTVDRDASPAEVYQAEQAMREAAAHATERPDPDLHDAIAQAIHDALMAGYGKKYLEPSYPDTVAARILRAATERPRTEPLDVDTLAAALDKTWIPTDPGDDRMAAMRLYAADALSWLCRLSPSAATPTEGRPMFETLPDPLYAPCYEHGWISVIDPCPTCSLLADTQGE